MTEEKEQSSESEEQVSAQEVATDETSPAEEPEPQTVPLDKHVKLRERAQTAELNAANLQGQITAIAAAQATQTPAAKSPLEVEVERQVDLGIPEAEMTVSPSVVRAENIHQRQIANQATKVTAEKQHADTQAVSVRTAMSKHEDWSAVIATGQGLLTPGEFLDVQNAGVNFGEVAYSKCQSAIERNKPVANTAPEEKPSESEAEEKVPTQQEILKGLHVDPAVEAAAKL